MKNGSLLLHTSIVSLSALALTYGSVEPAHALELSGTINANHDPSRIIEANGKYWIYSTGGVINVRSSTNLINWQWEAGVFNSIPGWMVSIGNSVGDNIDNIWAPDAIYAGGHYLNYYSRDIGLGVQEHAVLGVATAPTPGGPWTDQGEVIDVVVSQAYYRVIDPAPIVDQSGDLWVVVGSFGYASGDGYNNGGMRVYRMNAATGMRQNPSDTGTRIAGSWIEAPYLHYSGGYYWLFFNQARCCNGLSSTYYVRVGRATSITGPYSDMDGVSLLTPQEGGTLFMGLEYSANYSGAGDEVNPVEQANTGSVAAERGPGHIGIHEAADGIERVTYHFYDGTTGNGEPTLGMKSLVWGKNGWPRIGWEMRDGNYAMGTADGVGWIDGVSGSPTVGDWSGADSSIVVIERVSPNHFTIENLASGQALTGSGNSVSWAASSSASSQRWFIEQTNDGGFRVLNQSTGTALTRSGASLTLTSYAADSVTQNWYITPAGAHRIRSSHSGLELTADGSTAGSGVSQQSFANTDTHYWWLIPTPDGSSRIVNVGTGLALGVPGGSTNDNVGVEQQVDDASDEQLFSFDGLTDGTRRIVPEVSAKALGVVGASTGGGADIAQQRWTHVRNQQFELEFVPGYPSGGASGTGDPGGTGGEGTGGAGSGGEAGSGGSDAVGGSSSGGESSGGTGGTTPGCADGYVTCGEQCVHLGSDPLNCGACGSACAAGEVCSEGFCTPTCQAPLQDCGSVCADLSADPNNCGMCDVSCVGGQFCSAGACGASCAAGLSACGQGCVDLASNLLHCGACGTTCLVGQSCVGGVCMGEATGGDPTVPVQPSEPPPVSDAPAEEEVGCACSTPGSRGDVAPPWIWGALGLGWMWAWRRGRRRRA